MWFTVNYTYENVHMIYICAYQAEVWQDMVHIYPFFSISFLTFKYAASQAWSRNKI